MPFDLPMFQSCPVIHCYSSVAACSAVQRSQGRNCCQVANESRMIVEEWFCGLVLEIESWNDGYLSKWMALNIRPREYFNIHFYLVSHGRDHIRPPELQIAWLSNTTGKALICQRVEPLPELTLL